jgi:hypothetical protein
MTMGHALGQIVCVMVAALGLSWNSFAAAGDERPSANAGVELDPVKDIR